MKFQILIIFSLLATACQAQTQPAPAPDLKTLKWNLRDALKMQLPLTYPEKRGDREVKKSYSFDTGKATPTIWEIPEKLHDAATDTLFSGGKFFLPFENMDPASIQKIQSEDGNYVGIVIRAIEGKTFTYDPYYSAEDRQVTELRLGWWDHIQDRTLDRVLTLFKQVAGAMAEESKSPGN